MWYDYVCVIGVQGESMPTNTVQAVSPYYNPTIEEVSTVPNIKSAKKRILVAKTRNERNKSVKSAVKTAIKKVEAAVAANDKAAAEAALKDATSVIASAGSKGIFHKNNAARKVSRLTKLVNGLA